MKWKNKLLLETVCQCDLKVFNKLTPSGNASLCNILCDLDRGQMC